MVAGGQLAEEPRLSDKGEGCCQEAGSTLGRAKIPLYFWFLPFLLEFTPPEMRDEFPSLEKEDSILFFINPDSVVIFLIGLGVQRQGIQLKRTLKPIKTDLDVRNSPMIEKDRLVDARQHQMLIAPATSGRTLPIV
jgi:hypothetical protein